MSSHSKAIEKSQERRVLTDFINIYRCEPCLWMIKSHEYRDRQMKDVAYERLAAKLREIEPDADREKVVKKINCLRTNYRKEAKKLAERSEYKPRLWYYNLFDFLEGHEFAGPNPFERNESQDSLDDFDEYEADPLNEFFNEMTTNSESQEKQIRDMDMDEDEDENHHIEMKPTIENIPYDDSTQQLHDSIRIDVVEKKRAASTSTPTVTPSTAVTAKTHTYKILQTLPQQQRLSTTSTSRKRVRTMPNKIISDESDDASAAVDVAAAAYTKKHLSESSVSRQRAADQFEIFTHMIEIKMRSLKDTRQRLLAEKAINDALFMAEIGELTLERVNAMTQGPTGAGPYMTSSANLIDEVDTSRNVNGF